MVNQRKLKFGEPWSPDGLLLESMDAKEVVRTSMGVLFEGDCLHMLSGISDESVDLVFADPPFNLGKKYGANVNDQRPENEYVVWCHAWIDECVRILKPGGSFFLYNIPKWNILLGTHLAEREMLFRHWITVNIKFGLPIAGRLYPSHYSLLYYSKGKPKTFRKLRTPIETCRHCGGEIKDYGGHRGAMNPNGVNLTDVWNDIPPVRHWKFKSKKRKTNQLSTKLVRRCLDIGSVVGDIIVDPFGGAGTTFDVCEATGRHWIGSEIEPENIEIIVERLETTDLHHHQCVDYVEPL